jgi:hypothetical protein
MKHTNQSTYGSATVIGKTESMIDIDEAGFKIGDKDRKRGKVSRHRRCNGRGKYKKGVKGVSLLMGISGDDQDPFEFHKLYTEGGTDTWRFFTYLEEFIDWLDVNRPNETFCFTMDNLNIHKHPVILDLILNSDHRVVSDNNVCVDRNHFPLLTIFWFCYIELGIPSTILVL